MRIAPYLRLSAFSIGMVLFATSCQNDEESPALQLDETSESVQETDLTGTLEDIDEVVLVGFQQNGFSDRTTVTLEEDLCDRTNITWLPAQKKMIIDFGEGCTSPRGVIRKGKIIASYTGRYWIPGTVITTTFENYYVDGKKIEGIREVKNNGFNEADKFFTFTTSVKGGKITWKDGTSRTYEARHSKKVYLTTSDRGIVYTVSGGSKGVNRNERAYLAEIVEPLIFFERCIKSGIKMPSKGLLKIVVEKEKKIIINFGNEGCDREVIISIGDRSKTIILPRS
jgi:hypothetical protein